MAGGAVFFQAEDGRRDYKVTGVQTCALPIWPQAAPRELAAELVQRMLGMRGEDAAQPHQRLARSAERRVGEERRSRRTPQDSKKKAAAELVPRMLGMRGEDEAQPDQRLARAV